MRSPTEREFQNAVIEFARLLGYERIAHFRPAMNRRGHWSTPMQGDPGFPDLVLAKPGRLIFLECKVGKNKPTPDQEAWLKILSWVPGVVARAVWPDDLDELAELFRRDVAPTALASLPEPSGPSSSEAVS